MAQQVLRARDTETGEIVEFRWFGDAPPTEADLAEVFEARRQQQPEAEPGSDHPHAALARGVGRTLANVPESASRFAGDLANLFKPSTYQAIGSDPVSALKGVASHYADRISHPLETIEEDPVGALADVSSLATGGGALLRGLSSVGRAAGPAKTMAELGAKMGQAGAAVDPLAATVRGAGKFAEGVGRRGVATGLGRQALTSIADDLPGPRGLAATERAETVAARELPRLTRGGIRSLEDVGQSLRRQREAVTAPQAGTKVSTEPILARLMDEAISARSAPVTGDLPSAVAIERVAESMIDRLPSEMTIAELDTLRQQMNKLVGDLPSDDPTRPALKQLQKALQEETRALESAVIPELGPIGARQRDVLAVLEGATPRVAVPRMPGLPAAGGAAAGAGVTAGLPAALGVGAGVHAATSPTVMFGLGRAGMRSGGALQRAAPVAQGATIGSRFLSDEILRLLTEDAEPGDLQLPAGTFR